MACDTKSDSSTKTSSSSNDEITANFRTAANAVTKLYKSVSCEQTKIQDEGYLQALDDMLMACDSGINVWEWAVKRRLALINKYSSGRGTDTNSNNSPRSDGDAIPTKAEDTERLPNVDISKFGDFTFKSSFDLSVKSNERFEDSTSQQNRIFSTSPQRSNSTASTNHLRLAPFMRRRDANVVDEIIEDIKYLSNDSNDSSAPDTGKRRTGYNEYMEKGIDKLHQNNIYKRSRS